jgi:small subunit ribosomal protein S6
MRNYEVVYIFHPALDDEGVQARLERFHALLTGHRGLRDHRRGRLGDPAARLPSSRTSRRAATWWPSSSPTPASLPEFERILKLEDELLRYLVVLSEGEPTTGMSILAEVPESVANRESDDDDGRRRRGR